ncbi:hypothetical protein GCM10023329_01600 [Streptomyces sanyensis]|uniref:4'-phosphopantetheinyl transferase n=1 Tax=Streptomyces sanyensis TaxID=568869 RepID=A0ABP8ZM98_9ACTN
MNRTVAAAPGPALAGVGATPEVLALPGLTEDLLAPWEARRLAKIRRAARRDDVLASRLLLRLCVSRLTGRPPGDTELAQRCPGCGRHGHGRPYLPGHPGLGVSLSHADGVVAAAAGPGPTGVDVEAADRRPPAHRTLRRLLTEAELRAAGPGDAGRLRAWVRCEARFKAGGQAPRVRVWSDARTGAVAAVATSAPAVVFSLRAAPG